MFLHVQKQGLSWTQALGTEKTNPKIYRYLTINASSSIIKESLADKKVQPVKVLATQTQYLSSIPGTHTVEGEKHFAQVITCICPMAQMPLPQTNKYKQNKSFYLEQKENMKDKNEVCSESWRYPHSTGKSHQLEYVPERLLSVHTWG